jgi:hypothetical protein
VKTLLQAFVTKELATASQQHTISHFPFHQEFFTKNNMIVIIHPPYFSVFPTEDKTERPPFWHD